MESDGEEVAEDLQTLTAHCPSPSLRRRRAAALAVSPRRRGDTHAVESLDAGRDGRAVREKKQGGEGR